MDLKKNYFNVKERIARAAKKSGRQPDEIKLACISKQRSVKEIQELQKLGQKDFGENRLKELEEKSSELNGINWHFVGNLQTNKAKKTVEICDYIHSVDSLKLLRKIHSAAQELDKTENVFIEVNVSGEKTKHGFAPKELPSFLDTIKQLPFSNVRVVGLMTMAPLAETEKTRTIFRTLFELATANHLKELSMGMTNDFKTAIEEGATMVRIGTAIFGK